MNELKPFESIRSFRKEVGFRRLRAWDIFSWFSVGDRKNLIAETKM